MTGPAFDPEQRRVLRGMAAAALVTLVTLALAGRLWPVAPPAGRLAFALQCELFVFAWVVAAVARVASGRFASPADIAGSGLSDATPPLRRAQAILQNTLEQAVIAAPAHVVLALLLPAGRLGTIPLLVILFGIGRAAFALGYAHGAGARAFGFGLTFYPTVAAYVWAALLIVRQP